MCIRDRPEGVSHSIEAHDAATGALLRIGYDTDDEPNHYDQTGFWPLPNNEVAKLFANDILILRPNDYICLLYTSRYLAIRQYQQCVEALREHLDVAPDAETVRLYESILRQSD